MEAIVKDLAWPFTALIAFVFFSVLFRAQIADRVSNVRTATLSKDGFSVEIADRVSSLVNDAVATSTVADKPAPTQVQNDVRRLVSTPGSGAIKGKQLLWVDDRPPNNAKLVSAFEELGVDVTIALNTTEALSAVGNEAYDFIISDMARPPDQRAGYTLLEELRSRGIGTPVLIYAGSSTPQLNQAAIQHGAVGSTNRPDEVFRIVTQALRGS